MSFKIVEKFPFDGSPKEIKSLDVQWFESLLKHPKSTHTQTFFKELYNNGHWILCSCSPYAPVCIKYIKGNSTFILARVPYRKTHNANCPLYRMDLVNKAIQSEKSDRLSAPVEQVTNQCNTFALTKDYSKRFNNCDKTGLIQVDHSDPFYSYVSALLNFKNQTFSKHLTQQSTDQIKLTSASFLLDKKGLFQRLFFDFFKGYKEAKDLVSQEIKSGTRHPTCLSIMHINDIEWSSNNSPTKIITFKNKSNEQRRYITSSFYSPITAIGPLPKTGPFVMVSIIGKTGEDRNGQPFIGPLHSLILPALNWNDFTVAAGVFSRIFLRCLYTYSQTVKAVKTIKFESHCNNDEEVVFLKFSNKIIKVLLSPYGEKEMDKFDIALYKLNKSNAFNKIQSAITVIDETLH